ANGPDYRVRGIEGEIIWRLGGLTFASSFAWNHSEQISSPSLIGTNGQAVALFPTAGLGSPLAQSPPFQGNIRIRDEHEIAGYLWYGQVAAQHSAHSYASVITQGGYEPPNQPQ